MLRSWGLWVVLLLTLLLSLNMAQRSTRNKIRLQGETALVNLRMAQKNLTQIGAFADGRSDVINEFLPVIMASLETVTNAVDSLTEKL